MLIKKDLNGKPVFLEDTGEKLGTVFDTIYDEENKLVGYKIKDNKSEAVLSFPANQFEVEKNGLIFVPSWYTNAVKIIEKLEFKDRISPELTALLTDDAVSNNELYEIFVKHDDEMAHYIDDTVLLKERLNTRLKLLEKQRMTLKEELINLTEKRLIKDIDRKEFSEDVMEFRRKANIIDVNIGKCKKLIKRIDKTSFGVIGKYQGLPDIKEEHPIEKTEKIYQEISKPVFEENVKNPYKEKYLDLKEQFNHLEEEYNDLKTAVEKLIHKDELLKTE